MKIGVGTFTAQVPRGGGAAAKAYEDLLALAHTCEELGFDSVWLSEHHFAGDNYLSAPVPVLAALAATTNSIGLGTSVMLAPFHNPVRLAEDLATIDNISPGRLMLGFGLGWRAEEFRAFGMSSSSRVRRTVELIEVLRLAWGEDRLSYTGRYNSYSQIQVTPKPVRAPTILLGGFSEASIERAGRIADGYISSRVPTSRAEKAFELVREASKQAGNARDPIVMLMMNVFTTERGAIGQRSAMGLPIRWACMPDGRSVRTSQGSRFELNLHPPGSFEKPWCSVLRRK